MESVIFMVDYDESRVGNARIPETRNQIGEMIRLSNGMTVEVELVRAKDHKPAYGEAWKLRKLIRT